MKLFKGESLIVFDEVQLFPRARESIKQLVLDGRYHFIETGSLISLRRNVENILIPSEGRIINMYPMDFKEFLWASGDEMTADVIRENFNALKSFGDILQGRNEEIPDVSRRRRYAGGCKRASSDK